MALQSPLDELKEKAKQVVVKGRPPSDLAGALRVRRSGDETSYSVIGPDPEELRAWEKAGLRIDVRPLSLEDLFIDVVEGGRP